MHLFGALQVWSMQVGNTCYYQSIYAILLYLMLDRYRLTDIHFLSSISNLWSNQIATAYGANAKFDAVWLQRTHRTTQGLCCKE